jgi:hypothetical protein
MIWEVEEVVGSMFLVGAVASISFGQMLALALCGLVEALIVTRRTARGD